MVFISNHADFFLGYRIKHVDVLR